MKATSTARNKGEAVCTDRRTVKRTFVEGNVLDALRSRLMAQEIYAAFVRSFMQEWKTQAVRSVEGDSMREELRRVERKVGNLVAAVADSGGSIAVYGA